MSVSVKICGLSTPEALDVALDAGADIVGFVFFPPSPRHLTFERAHALASRVLERAQKVALTVDADDVLLDAVVEALQPDMLQLHGAESPAVTHQYDEGDAGHHRRHGDFWEKPKEQDLHDKHDGEGHAPCDQIGCPRPKYASDRVPKACDPDHPAGHDGGDFG